MARSTAPNVGAKATNRCHDCHTRAEVTVTNGTVTIRACAVHADSYGLMADRQGLTLTVDADSSIAKCDRCPRFIGNNGRAAHRCH